MITIIEQSVLKDRINFIFQGENVMIYILYSYVYRSQIFITTLWNRCGGSFHPFRIMVEVHYTPVEPALRLKVSC